MKINELIEELDLLELKEPESLSDLIFNIRSNNLFKKINFLILNSKKSKNQILTKIHDLLNNKTKENYDFHICFLLLSLADLKVNSDVLSLSIQIKSIPDLKWASCLALSLLLRESLYGLF